MRELGRLIAIEAQFYPPASRGKISIEQIQRLISSYNRGTGDGLEWIGTNCGTPRLSLPRKLTNLTRDGGGGRASRDGGSAPAFRPLPSHTEMRSCNSTHAPGRSETSETPESSVSCRAAFCPLPRPAGWWRRGDDTLNVT